MFISFFLHVKAKLLERFLRATYPCFHCGEAMSEISPLTANFQNTPYPVCCHGCLSILNMVEDQGLAQHYLAAKLTTESEIPNAKSAANAG